MSGKTGAPNPHLKAMHEAMGSAATYSMHSIGAVTTLCLVAEILGRLERFCAHVGMSEGDIREAVDKNRALGKHAAQEDLDVAEGKAPSANARLI